MKQAARPSRLAAIAFAVLAAAFLATLVDAARLASQRAPAQGLRAAQAEVLRLTDLALFTEARYTRHRSLADLHSAFQDHPMSLKHFPSGSLLPPPEHLHHHAPLDRQATLPD